MQRLVLGIAVLFFVCVSSASSASHQQGYCERGLYIPTHVIECVNFCKDRGKVFTLRSSWHPADIRECKCLDESIRHILPDLKRIQCPKPECAPECLRG